MQPWLALADCVASSSQMRRRGRSNNKQRRIAVLQTLFCWFNVALVIIICSISQA